MDKNHTNQLDKKDLKKLVDEKYIKLRKHPTEDLFIYNYTAKCQYDRHWNDITLQCRGLICDKKGNIIARPFRKFFNHEELTTEDIPWQESFKVFDKMDGSLIIIFYYNKKWVCATRGSFDSEQAKKANEILQVKYKSAIKHLKRDRTYLFEIIWPGGKIVVDYGKRTELVLIGIINTETGSELDLDKNIGFPVVEEYGIKDFSDVEKIRDMGVKNKEGFVIKFESGFRFKIKFPEYKRLHKIITEFSNKAIWEYLKSGHQIDEKLIQGIPDELYSWIQKTKSEFTSQYSQILNDATNSFNDICVKLGSKFSRKEFADEATNSKELSSILFYMLDEKDVSQAIWNMIKPKFEKPFFTNNLTTA